jgi:uncharacterized protein (UPF0248 family)
MKLKEVLDNLKWDSNCNYENYIKYKKRIHAYFKYDYDYIFIEHISSCISIVYLTNDISEEMEGLISTGHGKLILL